jgi:hypothetical protein
MCYLFQFIAPTEPYLRLHFVIPERRLHFPHLQRLVVSLFSCKHEYGCYGIINDLLTIIFRGCRSDAAWHCLWIQWEDFGEHQFNLIEMIVLCMPTAEP